MHPTIKNAQQGLSVLDKFASEFQKPSIIEGYNRLIYLKLSEQSLGYTRNDVTSIMQRLRDAPIPTVIPSFSGFSQRGKPQHNRGNRSRGSSSLGYTRGRGSSRPLSNLRGRGRRLGVHQGLSSDT